jgi:hypothetical protein
MKYLISKLAQFKEWILYSVMHCVCQLKGHEPEKHLNETEGWIFTTRCKKCHITLMGGFMLKFKHIPPPNSTPKQIKKWEDYCETKWQQLRDSCL